MPLTPEEQARLDALNELIGTGAQRAEFEGAGVRREMEVHSLADLAAERGRLEAKKHARPRRSLITYQRGR